MAFDIGARHRGTLQPEKPVENAVKCELCGCHWVPGPGSFGCPGCALMDELKDFHTHDPA